MRATTARLPAGGDLRIYRRLFPMSGHSKWNNIKRKKEKTDGAKAKVFTKIGREISVAVRTGGPNPASNSKLADLIAKAKRMSVPNDNIQRIIKKAEGGDKTEYEAITYEGYGPGGVAVIDRKSTRLNSSHSRRSRMPSSA